jgi:hypothetical protein
MWLEIIGIGVATGHVLSMATCGLRNRQAVVGSSGGSRFRRGRGTIVCSTGFDTEVTVKG